MVEGKVQIEGEVIHVIVQRCYDLSRLLRHLTPSYHEENPQVQTLARPDESSIPSHNQNNRPQVRVPTQEKLFPDARNFR